MTSKAAETLRSRYAAQVASDLDENHRLQRELAERIKVLEQEEALLVNILRLAEGNRAGHDGGAAEIPSKPSAPSAPSKSPKPSKEAPPAPPAPPQPLLGALLLDLLGAHQEPRPAKELRDELMAKHPERTPTPQVVRNTLESLVAKSRIRRHKQQRSVMYTVIVDTAPDGGPAGTGVADSTADSEDVAATAGVGETA